MEEKSESRRPEDSNFKQQRLKAWQPLLTPKWVISSFLLIGIAFVVIGGIVLNTSQGVVEIEKRYDDTCAFGTVCNVALTVTKEMKPPVYFYYKLTNFYQNHRRYVKSRDDTQLSGKASDSSTCDPLETGLGGRKLVPCGLIAASFFNDTFLACLQKVGTSICNPMTEPSRTWVKTGIAWQSDVDKKFKAQVLKSDEIDITEDGVKLPSVEDEDFIVWMRTAGLPTFKKLYRKIEDPATVLAAGDVLNITVNNTYPVSGFEGQKAIVLSTSSWIGGKNDFLGLAYIIVGSICLALAFGFGLKHYFQPRSLGDTSFLSWGNGGVLPAPSKGAQPVRTGAGDMK
jgi:hypothetical protein